MSDFWKCGHPRTDENTQRIGKAGVRCRICRQLIAREYNRRKKGIYDRYPHLSRGDAFSPIPTDSQ